MPVELFVPPTVAVYAPGDSVTTTADSTSELGARPVASSSAADAALSRQLSLLTINELSEVLSSSVGSAKAESKKPAERKDGPMARMANLRGAVPATTKPPMATFSPFSTWSRVEMLTG